MSAVTIGVVGLGYWGPNLARVLHELGEADVRWGCDLREERLARMRRRYSTTRYTEHYEDMLADDDLEAVVIATPVSTHYELVLAALEAGKHVLVEKPLASSSAQAMELLDAAQASGRVLMPGHTFLYSPAVNTIRELIAGGTLGDIYFVSTSRVNLGVHQPDVSVVWDLGPHDFSILRYWLDALPTRVSAWSRSCILPGVPDVAFINMAFPSDTVAHVELSWLAPSKLRRTAVVGSERMVVYDDTSIEPVRLFDSGVQIPAPSTFGEFRLTYRTGDVVSPRIESAEPLALQVADFCASIREGREPRSSAQLGLEVVQLAEAVDRSLAADGAPVSVGGVPSQRPA